MRLLLIWNKSQTGVAYKRVAYIKKNLTLFCGLWNLKKYVSFVILFLCLLPIHWGDIVKKMLSKLGFFEKTYKERDGHIEEFL